MTTLAAIVNDPARRIDSYAQLGHAFSAQVLPAPLKNSHLASLNHEALMLLDLDAPEQDATLNALLLQQRLPVGIKPIARVYSGHQFGSYVPQLGDGRAMLLTEIRNSRGEHWEIELKGSGQTPFSRSGDGRAVLRSCIREYLGSEAMHHLGIPSTRALCLINSEEPVQRETLESGAMIARLAPSHVRFGSFEYFFHSDQHEQLRTLADYVIEHDFGRYNGLPDRYVLWFRDVVQRTAQLLAQWQSAGFAHGVMNTDNMSILGLTLDYGPFAFIDRYEPGFICNHSDHEGRYAFNRQPSIALWNLNCLAWALQPLIAREDLVQALELFETVFVDAFYHRMANKLALAGAEENCVDSDHRSLIIDWLEILASEQLDYHQSPRHLADHVDDHRPDWRNDMRDLSRFDHWWQRWQQQRQSNSQQCQMQLQRANPLFVARNHHLQQAIAAAESGDFGLVRLWLERLQQPFAEAPEYQALTLPPAPDSPALIISCSS